MNKTASKTIDGYIAGYRDDKRELLTKLRTLIQKSAPQAEEAIRYGIPTFIMNGNLVHFGAFEHHIGFYPTSSGVKEFAKELAKYKTSKGAIQFPLGHPLPTALITKIVKFRVAENSAKAEKKSKADNKQHIEYHRDGSVWAKGKKINNLPEGHWKWYRKDGTLMRSGTFLNGVQCGTWTTYDKEGNAHKITIIEKKAQ